MSTNRTRLALNGPEKYQLCLWAERNLDRVMAVTIDEAAILAADELNIALTGHNIRGALSAIGAPPRRTKIDPTSKAAMAARIESLEEHNHTLTHTLIDMCGQLNLDTNTPAWIELKEAFRP